MPSRPRSVGIGPPTSGSWPTRDDSSPNSAFTKPPTGATTWLDGPISSGPSEADKLAAATALADSADAPGPPGAIRSGGGRLLRARRHRCRRRRRHRLDHRQVAAGFPPGSCARSRPVRDARHRSRLRPGRQGRAPRQGSRASCSATVGSDSTAWSTTPTSAISCRSSAWSATTACGTTSRRSTRPSTPTGW